MSDRYQPDSIAEPCVAWADRVDALIDEELPVDARAEVERHLSGCDACARYGEQHRALTGALGKVRSARLDVDLAPQVAAAARVALDVRWRLLAAVVLLVGLRLADLGGMLGNGLAPRLVSVVAAGAVLLLFAPNPLKLLINEPETESPVAARPAGGR